ncbi:dynein light chain, cytoplasmic [Emergomyces africanus]|uniref:Dynein light chain, cytoplasmic n=1 Tax=Emergomyces africanus TaxID=1955775 RepID=A0A1B7P2W9_9EURO|nr:dynein light chain, cytoplasmic [Emergomyces africanus]
MATEKREKLEAQIKSADMPSGIQSEDMQQEAIEVATEAMDKYHIEKDIAQYIKKEAAVALVLPLLELLALLVPGVPSWDALDTVQVDEALRPHLFAIEHPVVYCVEHVRH